MSDDEPKIELAKQDATEELGAYVEKVLEAIGHPEALITDESTVHDFLDWTGTAHRVYRRGGRGFKALIGGPYDEEPANPAAVFENAQLLRKASERLGISIDPKDKIVALALALKNKGTS